MTLLVIKPEEVEKRDSKFVDLVKRAKNRAMDGCHPKKKRKDLTKEEAKEKELNTKALSYYKEHLKSEEECEFLVSAVDSVLDRDCFSKEVDENAPPLSQDFHEIVCNLCD